MYIIRIEIEGGPVCQFLTSESEYASIAVWEFMIEHLKPGLRVVLVDEKDRVVKAAVSGDTKKLGSEFA